MSLSVVIVTQNEEASLARTLESVRWPGGADGRADGGADSGPHGHMDSEIIVLDSGSTDNTVAIARGFGAKVFVEEWKGYAAQKNSALAKATGDWVLALDADEVVAPELADTIRDLVARPANNWDDLRSLAETMKITFDDRRWLRSILKQLKPGATVSAASFVAYRIPFKHHFLGRWLRWGGMYPDRKVRLFRRGHGRFRDRAVHESVEVTGGATASLQNAILHYGYPTLAGYLAAMDRYSTLAAGQMLREGRRPLPFFDTVLRPALTFLGRYLFRLGFLDGREGLLFHYHHARYVRWKYTKALARLASRS